MNQFVAEGIGDHEMVTLIEIEETEAGVIARTEIREGPEDAMEVGTGSYNVRVKVTENEDHVMCRDAGVDSRVV